MATANPEPRSSGRDAVDILVEDHRRIEELFTRYEASTNADAQTRKALVDEMIRELSMHAAVEEQYFYPAVAKSVAEGEGLVDESLHEHQEVKDVLAELDDMDADDSGFDQRVHRLIREVRHHAGEEEGEILPKLREAVGESRMMQIGEQLEEAKKIAPTRPHPHAPNTPPGNMVAGPMAATVDRVRDAVMERGEDED
jgi:hemerythrin superfamily protein